MEHSLWFSKKIITNSEVNSYLCSSYAWDTAVNFIQNNSTAKNYATSIEGFNGNWNPQAVKDPSGNVIKPAGTSQQLNTGLTTQFCNIFDMGGNEAEFTTELNPGTSETDVLRGGDYISTTTFQQATVGTIIQALPTFSTGFVPLYS